MRRWPMRAAALLLALLLPAYFGLDGILLSMPVSDVLTFVLSATVIVRTRRALKAPEKSGARRAKAQRAV